MAVSQGHALVPPPVWIRTRAEVLAQPLFRPPSQLEVWDGTQWVGGRRTLPFLTKDWRPGLEDDGTSVQGRLRLSLPSGVPPGPLVFMARGRGKLSAFRVDGQEVWPSWMGLDAAPKKAFEAPAPRGWHPFTFRAVSTGSTLEIVTGGLKLSLLALRTTGGP